MVVTDEEWLAARYFTATEAQIERFVERVAICMESGVSDFDARKIALSCLRQSEPLWRHNDAA